MVTLALELDERHARGTVALSKVSHCSWPWRMSYALCQMQDRVPLFSFAAFANTASPGAKTSTSPCPTVLQARAESWPHQSVDSGEQSVEKLRLTVTVALSPLPAPGGQGEGGAPVPTEHSFLCIQWSSIRLMFICRHFLYKRWGGQIDQPTYPSFPRHVNVILALLKA